MEKNSNIKEFYTLEQLSKELDFNIQSLRKFVKNGSLEASKVGTKYVITRDNVIKWLENNRINK